MRTKQIGGRKRKVSFLDRNTDSEQAGFRTLGELLLSGVITTTGYTEFAETPILQIKSDFSRWLYFFIIPHEEAGSDVYEVSIKVELSTNTPWQAVLVSIKSWPLQLLLEERHKKTQRYIRTEEGRWIPDPDYPKSIETNKDGKA